jgi:hypothetical protein
VLRVATPRMPTQRAAAPLRSPCLHASAYVSMRQHTCRKAPHAHSARSRASRIAMPACVRIRPHTSACVSIRQHTPRMPTRAAAPLASPCLRPACQHTAAYVSACQHTSAYVSAAAPLGSPCLLPTCPLCVSIRQHTSAYVRMRQDTSGYVRIRQHTSAYVSIRQHNTSTCVSIRQCMQHACVRHAGIASSVFQRIHQHTSAYVNACYTPASDMLVSLLVSSNAS